MSPQDTRIMISDGQWGEDLLCLLIFSSPGNAVNLPVVDGPDWTDTLAGDCLGPRHYWCTSPTPVL